MVTCYLLFYNRYKASEGYGRAVIVKLALLDCFSGEVKLLLFLCLPVSFLTTYFRHGKNLSILEILMLQRTVYHGNSLLRVEPFFWAAHITALRESSCQLLKPWKKSMNPTG